MFAELALIGLATVTVSLIGRHNQRKYRRVVEEMGLTMERVSFQQTRIAGVLHDVYVSVESSGQRSRIQISDVRIPESLRLTAEDLLTRTLAQDVKTGDADFDHHICVEGDPPSILALLDYPTRQLALTEIRAGASIAGRQLDRKMVKLSQALEALPNLAELATRLTLSEHEIPQRLARQAATDPNGQVRTRCLRVLQSTFPDSEAAFEASTTCLGSSEAEERLAATDYFVGRSELDEETARRTAEVLAEIADRDRYREAQREQALRSLCQARWRAEALPILEATLEEPPVPEAIHKAAIEGIVQFLGHEAVPALERTEPRAQGVAAEALAEALGRLGDAGNQPCLLRLLARDARGVRFKTIEALARLGDAAAVEPLLALTGSLLPDQVSKAAALAVAKIQARIGTGEPGQLSLVEPTDLDGALSPAEDQAGPGDVSLEET